MCSRIRCQFIFHMFLQPTFDKMSSATTFLLVCGIFLSLPHSDRGQTWQKFKEQHIDDGNRDRFSCDKTMIDPIYNTNGACKACNTFIFSTPEKIMKICRSISATRNVTGTGPFSLMKCTKKDKQKRKKNCHYKEQKNDSAICLTCEANKPVHFVKIGRC